MLTEQNNQKLHLSHFLWVGFFLVVIILVKIFLSLHLFKEVSVFVNSDALLYLTKAREILAGNWWQIKTHAMGWPVILAPFFWFLKGTQNFEYMALQQSVSLIFSLLSVPIFFLLSKKFLKDASALLATTLFALSPHLIENSISGLTETSFIFVCLLSFLLFLNQKPFSFYLAFLLAGAAVWIRTNGLAIIVAYLVVAIFIYKKNRKEIFGAILCFLVFFLPYLIERYHQFGSIFDYGAVSRYLHFDYRTVWAENTSRISFPQFIQNDFKEIFLFLLGGLRKFLNHLRLLLSPLVVFLLFPGIWLLIKKRTQNLKSLAVLFLINLALIAVIYPAYGNVRHVLILYPFLIILALLFLDEIPSLNQSKFLASLLIISLLFSAFITARMYFFYNPVSSTGVLEIITEGQYLAKNLKGKIVGDAGHIQVFMPDIHCLKENDNAVLSNGQLTFSSLYAEDLTGYIAAAKKYGFNLLYVKDKNIFSFLDDVYNNENKYTRQLKKIYDTQQAGLKNIKGKVFVFN